MDINCKVLKEKKYNTICDDFLLMDYDCEYNRIIANPPFAKNQDIDHVRAMYKALDFGGRLVSITSESWVTGSQKKQVDFRNWLNEVGAEVQTIDKGAFKESGTMVGGRILVIDK